MQSLYLSITHYFYYIKKYTGQHAVNSVLVFYSKHKLSFCLMITAFKRGCERPSDGLGKHEEIKQALVNEDASLLSSKLLLLTYKALNGLAPAYLTNLL